MICTILKRKEYEVLTQINNSWSKYDMQVAECQLDDFDELEQLYSDYKSKVNE